MQTFLQNKLPNVIDLCKKHKVTKLYAFGSVCTDHFNEQSDIDFIISFSEIPLQSYADNYFDLKESLEKLLLREVDLVVEKTLSNPYLLKVIEKTKTPIYA